MSTSSLTGRPLYRDSPFLIVQDLFSTRYSGVYRVQDCRNSTELEKEPITKIIKLVKKGHFKSFLDNLQRDYDISQYLQQESTIRDHIVKCEEFLRMGSMNFVVKEDDGGESLRRVIQRCHTNEQRIHLFWGIVPQLLHIIDSLHRLQVIHLDIKPDNIIAIPQRDGTHKIKLLDFSISSLVSLQTPYTTIQFDTMIGTPQFMSPEQSGKMTSQLDKRADIYSLGCTMYNILTGELVFPNCVSNKQWMNAHLKDSPEAIELKNDLIPLPLQRVIRKMMQKQPSSRYNSVAGIIQDLHEIYTAQQNSIPLPDDWKAGHNDINDQFALPTKMYGRESEFQRLISSLNAAEQGSRREAIFISGVSGVGKTRIVQELQCKYSNRAWFLSSKYDLISQVPYQSLTTIVSQVVSTLLTEDERHLRHIREHLLEALDGLGVLLTNLSPELEQIIGKQKAIGQLNNDELLNKMSQATLSFFRIISKEYSRMLVLFLDDLQWSAVNDLKVLESVLLDASLRVLVIGSYRSNEVDSSHHLYYFIERLRESETQVSSITLGVLNDQSLVEYVSDLTMVPQTEERVQALAKTISQATQGNPFYVREIVNKMHIEGIFSYDYTHHCWHWSNQRVKQIQFASNVIDLMLSSVHAKLTEDSQQLLQIAAMIGSTFDLYLLREVAERVSLSTTDLVESIHAGWIVELADDQFRWQHDKLQEAAYSMLSPDQRTHLHLMIGKTLLEKFEDNNSKLFDILSHLNKVIDAVQDDPVLLNRVRELNIRGCSLARNSNAFEQAIVCANMALDLMGEESWSTFYEEAYNMHVQLALAHFSAKDPKQCIKILERAEKNVREVAHSIELASEIIQVLIHFNRIKEAYEKFSSILEEFPQYTFNMPQKDKKRQIAWIEQRMEVIMPLLMDNLSTLPQLKNLTDPVAGAFIHLLGEGSPTALTHSHIDELLLPCICLLSGEYVLKYGISEYTPIALVNFSMAIGKMTKDFSLARKLSHAGFVIGIDRFQQDKFLCHAYFSEALHSASDNTLQEFVIPCEKSVRCALVSGEYSWGTNTMLFSAFARLLSGWDLDETKKSLARGMKIASDCSNLVALCLFNGFNQVVEIAQGDRDSFTEQDYPVPELIHLGFIRLLHNASGAIAYLYLHDYQKAYEYSSLAVSYTSDSETMIYESGTPAIHILVLSRLLSTEEAPDMREKYIQDLKRTLLIMRKHDEGMKKMWKDIIALAETHLHIVGEKHMTRGTSDSEDLSSSSSFDSTSSPDTAAGELALSQVDSIGIIHAFENVISVAHNHKSLLTAHIAGLDVAAFARKIGSDSRFVQLYFSDALNVASYYKAYGYCGLLKTVYSSYSLNVRTITRKSSIDSTLSAKLTPSPSLAREGSFSFQRVNLEVLFHSMLPVIVEETGASRVGLVLSEQFLTDLDNHPTNFSSNKYFLQYMYDSSRTEKIVKVAKELPVTKVFCPLVNRVLRSRIRVVIDDVVDSDLPMYDEKGYFQKRSVRSLLVQPLIYNTVVAGVLYLENNHSPGIFNKLRQNSLQTLISVCLHSSHFYSKLSSSMSRFLPSQFLKQLGVSNVTDVMADDCVERDMAVLFLDIRSFSQRLEDVTTKSAFRFVNTFLNYIAPEIDIAGGFIDKYVGSALLSLYPEGSVDALISCMGIMNRLQEMNQNESRENPIRIGIGIHEGMLMLGTVGYKDRLDASCISDTVNTASRLESLSSAFGVNVLLSQEVYNSVQQSPMLSDSEIRFRKVGTFFIKGKKIPKSLYEAYSPDWEVHTPERQFDDIVKHFCGRRFDACISLCEQVLEDYPHSNLCRFYKLTSLVYSKLQLPLAWNGEIKVNKDGDPISLYPSRTGRSSPLIAVVKEGTDDAKPRPEGIYDACVLHDMKHVEILSPEASVCWNATEQRYMVMRTATI